MTRAAPVSRWLWFLAAPLLALAAWRFVSQPLFVDYPTRSPRRDLVAVLVSGDVGLRAGMGQRIARRLAAAGVPVVGINSPAFFLTRRKPAEITGLIEHAAHCALKGRPDASLVLIGQSFGADVLPIAVNRVPAELRARLALVALIVPTRTVYRRISLAEYLDAGAPDDTATVEARRIVDVPLLCIHGEREPDSLCPLLHGANLTSVTLPGGHPLRRDADRLFAALWSVIGAKLDDGRRA